jgi:hypothetical protein
VAGAGIGCLPAEGGLFGGGLGLFTGVPPAGGSPLVGGCGREWAGGANGAAENSGCGAAMTMPGMAFSGSCVPGEDKSCCDGSGGLRRP